MLSGNLGASGVNGGYEELEHEDMPEDEEQYEDEESDDDASGEGENW